MLSKPNLMPAALIFRLQDDRTKDCGAKIRLEWLTWLRTEDYL